MNATKLLEDWTRKGYYCKIQFHGGYYPGDGFHVELWNHFRKVDVADYDHPGFDKDNYVSLEDLVLFALKKWESDLSQKHYEVLFVPEGKRNDNPDERLVYWHIWCEDRLHANVWACNDKEASEVIYGTFGSLSKVLGCRERPEKLTLKES